MNKLRRINRYGSVLVLTATVLLLLFALSAPVQANSHISGPYNPDGTPVTGGTNAPDPTASGCPEARAWEIEDGLGINALGGFDPTGLDIIGWLVVAGLGLAAVLALVMIVFGGVRYIVGAGNSGQQEKAKETIRNALLGLILAMASTLILYTINPQFTTLRLPQLIDVSPEALQIRESTQRACAELTGDDSTGGKVLGNECTQGLGQCQAPWVCKDDGSGSNTTCQEAEGDESDDACFTPGFDCTGGLVCAEDGACVADCGSYGCSAYPGYVCVVKDTGGSVCEIEEEPADCDEESGIYCSDPGQTCVANECVPRDCRTNTVCSAELGEGCNKSGETGACELLECNDNGDCGDFVNSICDEETVNNLKFCT